MADRYMGKGRQRQQEDGSGGNDNCYTNTTVIQNKKHRNTWRSVTQFEEIKKRWEDRVD
jgi:hypothetical protein